MTGVNRRDFLRLALRRGSGALVTPSLAGLVAWNPVPGQATALMVARRRAHAAHQRPLVRSRECPEFRIPEGFRCVRISRTAAPSQADPSFRVPAGEDGMAAFALPNGNIRLIRNHELRNPPALTNPIGPNPYDRYGPGGTTSLEVAIRGWGPDLEIELLAEYVSLSGTHTNCAGGPTPWGSWLTCEETTVGRTQGYEQSHGYVFEVPVSATEPADPVPLRALGRFVHEAVAIDEETGIVYLTEDRSFHFDNPEALPGSGFYRFIPRRRGELTEGGRLQMLAIEDRPRYRTFGGQRPGVRLPTRWVEIEDPDPLDAATDPSSMMKEGLSKGGAVFQRLEGCFAGDDGIFFVATSGGDARAGQVFHYRPTDADAGELTLVFESPSPQVLDAPDNICLTRAGSVVICEDGGAEQYIRALRPNGEIVDLVLAPTVQGQPGPPEFCGSTFSPDGRVLFFNVQGTATPARVVPGGTFALWGDWEALAI